MQTLLLKVMNRFKSQINFLHVLKDAKPQVRHALLTFTDDDLIKAIFECAINAWTGNHKLTEEDKGKLSKYKNRLLSFVKPKNSFKCKRILLIEKAGL